jgi:energy-coupling factor transport system permease protein
MHRMDPLSKLAWICALGIFGFVISAPAMLAVLVVTTHVVAFALGKVSFQRYIRAAPYLYILGASTGFFQVLIRSRGPDVILHLGPFALTEGGILFGLTYALRITLISFASLVFIWTTDPRDLIVGLIYLKVPYRIAYAVFVALRFVPLLENEAAVIREAQAVRGVEAVHGKLEAMKRYVLPLLVAGVRRSEATAVAMDSRAFGAFPHRTFIKNFNWTASGIGFLCAFVVLGVVLTALAAQMGQLYQQ